MDKVKLLIVFAVVALICSCGDDEPSATGPKFPDYTPKFGTVFDERDGRTYKTTVINGLEWMAENLNYAVDSSFCYNDEPAYCEKYGRLYRWESAMALDTTAINVRQWTEGKKYQGVCPQGWHLPTKDEFMTLIQFTVAWKHADDPVFLEEIGYIHWYYLKSKDGWDNTSPENDYNGGYSRDYANYRMSEITRNGSDTFVFSMLPSGWRNDYQKYDKEGRCAAFWTSDEREILGGVADNYFAIIANYFCYEYHDFKSVWKDHRVSVRCVKD